MTDIANGTQYLAWLVSRRNPFKSKQNNGVGNLWHDGHPRGYRHFEVPRFQRLPRDTKESLEASVGVLNAQNRVFGFLEVFG
jgi:hypothetical protein